MFACCIRFSLFLRQAFGEDRGSRHGRGPSYECPACLDKKREEGFPWDHFNYVLSLMKGSGNSSFNMTTAEDLII